MDIIRLFQDYNIDFITEGNKHCTPGWANTHCPFCEGSRNYHLGVNLSDNYFVCWRCGWHPNDITISKLLGVSIKDTREIIRLYGGTSRRATKAKDPVVKMRAFKFPTGTGPMLIQHKKYLQKRNYDYTKLETEWGLLGTGPMAMLDDLNYCHRVIAPIYWDDKIVSFQGRDITGKSELKYLTCPQKREIIQHKHILYGQPAIFTTWDTCICVEGIFDAWAVGKYAVATFGIKYTGEQLRLLSKFKKVIVWFDQEKQAQEQASKLVSELRFRGVKTEHIFTPDDPADTPKDIVFGNIYKYIHE